MKHGRVEVPHGWNEKQKAEKLQTEHGTVSVNLGRNAHHPRRRKETALVYLLVNVRHYFWYNCKIFGVQLYLAASDMLTGKMPIVLPPMKNSAVVR